MNNTSDDYLFPPSLIRNVTLPTGYKIRPLVISDYSKGFYTLLSQLTTVVDLSREQFCSRFYEMQSSQSYYIVVIEDQSSSKVVATGTLLVEKKFIRSNGLCGHIEDVVVSKDERKKDFGKIIIDTLVKIAASTGCYKVILDCNESNIPFYSKCGFKQKEIQMALYFSKL
eukprot:TRINITY_DN7725_c0_g1_i1.p1 TRINITY_DN7725_c0_g1~~TRINITY_DN7725_c0_g1_i1.p1  ORF type:complete len:170 (+),score=26.86 TRINITY_DN7725_c0_g1_i1:10-519(+)